MNLKFNLVKGVKLQNLEGIKEGWRVSRNEEFYSFTINVSAEHIDMVFKSLCAIVRTPAFLLLECGTNANDEKELRQSDTDPFHKDVYYLDGLSFETFISIYNKYSGLLIDDGEINFGFGSHSGVDEVFVGSYKVFTIFTDNPQPYAALLTELGFKEREHLKTVYENFSMDTPASRQVVTHNGLGIYEMIELLKDEGLYLAERREDN